MMAFESTDLTEIYDDIRQRQTELGRLSLVEFEDDEYATLLDQAQHIVRKYRYWEWQPRKQQQARLIFLAFAMAFVRRYKYTDDDVFWPDFEDILSLRPMAQRLLIDDLLWTAYEEEGLALSYDGRGRRIVGTLADEMRQARTWVTQARSQFVEFFKWYFRRHPGEDVTNSLIAAYGNQTNATLVVLDKVLPALTRHCQTLAHVIDYAVENDLYLQATHLDDYRRQIIAALGPEYDPIRLRLVHNQQTLIRLILDLQNHRTPAQFERELRERRGGVITAPWGDRLPVHIALERWKPFSFGIYRVEDQEYRVVPHPHLRLEMLDEWPLDQVIPWQSDRYLGYKKDGLFQVTNGRRTIEATPFWRTRGGRFYLWVGQAPIGEKLMIDGRLCPESTGADWRPALKLRYQPGEKPALRTVIERLVLYYPDRAHQPIRIWASTGFTHTDSLREDGVRRFHRHGALIIPLSTFDAPVEVGVTVGDETVLHQTFDPEPSYLFSLASRERVQCRGQADVGDREYLLFTREASPPQAGPGLTVTRLPEPYCFYTIYQVTWEDASQPFELQVGTARWAFQRRREFTPLFGPKQLSSHLRLKPHQFHRFTDVSLRLYSTLDLTTAALTLEIWDDDGPLAQFNLMAYIQPTPVPNQYDVGEDLWQEADQLTTTRWGRYALLFQQDEATLAEMSLTLIPPIQLEWDAETVYPEQEPFLIIVNTPRPAWNPATQQEGTRVQLTMRPRTQPEPWSEHSGLRRLVSEPVFAPLIFPDLGESVDITVRPRLFGLRLYLKHNKRVASGKWRTAYQPIQEADYYHLDQMVLYLFAAPEAYVEIGCGSLLIWTGQTNTNGDLLINGLSFLANACLDEHTQFAVRSERLQTSFAVKWAPLLYGMSLEDERLVARFHGPEGTALRLRLRDVRGSVNHAWEVPCWGQKTTVTLPLPIDHSGPGYVTAEYVLSDGQTRPAAQQVYVPGAAAGALPLSWLEEGIGVAEEDNLPLLSRFTMDR